jgi:hypothetical protein
MSGAGGIPAHPDTARSETVTKTGPVESAWPIVGLIATGLLVPALVAFAALWLVRRARGRRDPDRLRTDWDLPADEDRQRR